MKKAIGWKSKKPKKEEKEKEKENEEVIEWEWRTSVMSRLPKITEEEMQDMIHSVGADEFVGMGRKDEE